MDKSEYDDEEFSSFMALNLFVPKLPANKALRVYCFDHGTKNWIVMKKCMMIKIFGIFGGKIEEDIGSRLSRYPPDCSEVMVRVGGWVSVRRGVLCRRGSFLLVDGLKFKKIKQGTASFHCLYSSQKTIPIHAVLFGNIM